MPLKKPKTPAPAPWETEDAPSPRAIVPANQSDAAAALDAFGGISSDEVILAQIKLMQGQSPELQRGDPGAKIGEFLHTVAGVSLGKVQAVIPVWKKRSFELWGDRDSNQGLLASADETGAWDKPHHKFQIPTRTGTLTVNTKGSVTESGLLNFGTSDPSNPKSKPILAETYRLVFHIVDRPELSPVLAIYSRMASIRAKELLTRIGQRTAMGESVFTQVYEMRANLDRKGPNQYYTPHFSNMPKLNDPALSHRLMQLALNLSKARVIKPAGGEDDDAPAPARGHDYRASDSRDF